jgi:peroxiredoxin
LGELRASGLQVVVISFVQPNRLAQYLGAHRWPFPVLADPDRATYQAFGLERAGWSQLLKPRVWLAYLKLLFRGWMPRPALEDVHQLGGDFVLDRTGSVVYAHRSTDPADRPSLDELLQVAARIVPQTNKPAARET